MHSIQPHHPLQAPRCPEIPALVHADERVQPEAELQLWAYRVSKSYHLCVASIIAVGRILIEAKAAVPHGLWGRLFKGHPKAVAHPAPFTQNNAGRWMQIAKHPTLSNSAFGQNLPASWRTLYELSHLAAPVLEGLLAFGAVHPEMHCLEARLLRERYDPPTPRGISGMDLDIKDRLSRKIDQDILLHYVIDTNALLRRPLQLSADGKKIVAGVCWVQVIPRPVARPKPATKPSHACPDCGHVHTEKR